MDESTAISAALKARPQTPDELWLWIRAFTGYSIPQVPVCSAHQSPFDPIRTVFFDSPEEALILGPRGGGKSFGMGLLSDLRARFFPGHETVFLGGSLAQSGQGYQAIEDAIWRGPSYGHQRIAARDALEHLGKREARYRNRARTWIIAASHRAVHGPHAEDVYRDERDEMADDIAEAAVGMRRGSSGLPHTMLTASTWHRPSGSMSVEIESARERGIPFFASCIYEALERCPESWSGPRVGGRDLYLNCPSCPLRESCHSEVIGGEPKAKRARGHYPVKMAASTAGHVSPATWGSDYLCSGAKAKGVWYERFDPNPGGNFDPHLLYDPRLPSFGLSIDSGVWTAALFYQVAEIPVFGAGLFPVQAPYVRQIRFLGEDVSYDLGASGVAARLVETLRSRYGSRHPRVSSDPAGDAKTPIGGRHVLQIYEDAGLGDARHPIERWSRRPGSVLDQHSLVDALVLAADGVRRLLVGPGCPQLLKAFGGYRRKVVRGVFTGEPEQDHPIEDLMDACRGACALEFPDGVQVQARGLPRSSRGPTAADVF